MVRGGVVPIAVEAVEPWVLWAEVCVREVGALVVGAVMFVWLVCVVRVAGDVVPVYGRRGGHISLDWQWLPSREIAR